MNKLKPPPGPVRAPEQGGEQGGKEAGSGEALPKRPPLLLLGLTLLVWFPLITLLQAWVLTLFWAWFVVPQFAVAPLSLPIAAGLDLLFGFLAYRQLSAHAPSEAVREKFKELSWPERFGRMILPNFGLGLGRIGIILLFGFVVHLFVRR